MWSKISSLIIKNRILLLVVIIISSIFFAYKTKDLEISYDYIQIVPPDDTDFVFYKNFKKIFGEDGNIFVLGMQDKSLFTLEKFNRFAELCHAIKKISGVNDAISLPTLKVLVKDTVSKKFVLCSIFPDTLTSQKQLDSLLKVTKRFKMYKGLVHNENTDAVLVAISIEGKTLNSFERQRVVNEILRLSKKFSEDTSIELHYAGIPYNRTIMVKLMTKEFVMLAILSVLITSLILFLFFRSFYSVFFTLLVIIITLLITGGTIALLDYKITLLTVILPSLIIILSIPNCIYMYNMYHQEYRRHKNKVKAISRIIEKVGFLTFMTNINTAVGFFVLYFTDIVTIKEFGVSAGVLSVATFVISIVIIPTFLLFLPAPTEKQLKHLDFVFLKKVINALETVAIRHRAFLYTTTILFIGISVYGISKIQTLSYMVDDLPEESGIKSDLAFFEQQFKGVMPLEIIVDFGKKQAIKNPKNLRKLEEFENYLLSLNNISPPLSVLNIMKGANQAFQDGDPEFYSLPSRNELQYISSYFDKGQEKNPLIRSFIDSNAQVFRISTKVADLGTKNTHNLVYKNIQPKAKEIFSDSTGKTKVKITGTTLLFLKGNEFLINDLSESLLYAFILISLMMAFLFTNLRMIVISLIPNIIPMIFTAGIMGLFNIPLKPSTALIFGISFGISIDSTIHFLSKYKQQQKIYKDNALLSVIGSIRETGISMIYTSVVLFCGFIIYIFSTFGGTIALGMLTSITLFFAMFTNLTLLPALLLTFSKQKIINLYPVVKRKEEFYHYEDDEEYLDLTKLEIKKETEDTN